MINSKTKKNHEDISRTAWLTAYNRSFSDIYLSKKIFSEIEKIRKNTGKPKIPENVETKSFAPNLEARHKLISKLLAKTNILQILELAAGYTSRGLEFTKNKEVIYVEFDLPNIINSKVELIKNIVDKKENGNLHFEPGNVLNLYDLKKALVNFDKNKPIAIINEGLLRYLNFKEKAIVAKNIHKILKEFGGVWITSDISLKKIVNLNENKNGKITQKFIGKSITQTFFENENEAKLFFENLGFSIERHGFIEVINDLTSPEILNFSREKVENILSTPVVYVMKIK